MSDMIDQILEDAERELGLDKEANDENGAPENNSNQINGEDIFSVAQNFLAEVEQFKQALVGTATSNQEQQNAEEENLENTQNVADPNAVVPGGDANKGSSVIISRPDGTQIKLASLHKLASFRGRNFLREV